MTATIHQLSISAGGVPKLAVPSARLTPLGLEGDGHNDARNHGGPDRALCLYALEVIERLRAEGHHIAPGAAGENVTIAGLEWERVVPGARLRLGATALVEITGYTTPCWKNAGWFYDGEFNRMSQATHPGDSRVYAKVLEVGELQHGDPVELLEEDAATRTRRAQPPTVRWRPPGE